MTRPSLHLRASEALARLKLHLPPTLPYQVAEAIGELRWCIDEMAHEGVATAVEGGPTTPNAANISGMQRKARK